MMFRSLNTAFLGFKTDLGESIQAANAGGFEGVDLSLQHVISVADLGDATEIKALFERFGVRPGCFSLTAGIFSMEEAAWERELGDLPKMIAVLHAVGFRRALSVLLPFSEDLDYPSNLERHKKRIRRLSRMLLPFEIRLGLEYIAPLTRRFGYAHPFVHDMVGVRALIDAVDRPNVGVFLDCFHWYCAGESVDDILGLDPTDVVGVHINDAFAGRSIDEQIAFERQLPGTSGLIDISGFLDALVSIGYDGPVTCEPMYKELGELPLPEAVNRTAAAMDSVMRSVGR